MPLHLMPAGLVKLKEYNCPVCGNNNSKQFDIEYVLGITLNCCNYCGYIYRKNYLDNDSWMNFCKNYHRTKLTGKFTESVYQKDLIRYSLFRTYLKDFHSKNVRHLDIGTGFGKAVQLFGNNSVCIELAEYYYQTIRHYFKIDARRDYNIPDTLFELITITNLALIPDPQKLLINLNKKLISNGVLYINIPSIDYPSVDFFKNGLALEYFSFFNNKSIKNLLNESGFEIELFDNKGKDINIICRKNNNLRNKFDKLPEESYTQMLLYIECLKANMKKDLATIRKLSPSLPAGWVIEEEINLQKPVDISSFMLEAAKNVGDNFNGWAILALFYQQRGNLEEAIKYLKLMETKIWGFDIFLASYLCHYDAGIYDIAIDYMEKTNFMKGLAYDILERFVCCAMEIK